MDVIVVDCDAGNWMVSAMACGSKMNMKDLELRSVIKFLTKEVKKPKEIHERMNAVYDDVSPS